MNKKKKLDIIKKQILEHLNVVNSIVKIDNEILLFVNVLIETIKRTTLNNLLVGDSVNVELSATLSSKLGGHMVQGHVSGTGQVLDIRDFGKTWEFDIGFEASLRKYMILEGSMLCKCYMLQ
jgi:riboflavin synthase